MNNNPSSALVGLFLICVIAACLLVLIGLWKVFTKAGRPGWECIIPIYNAYCLIKIASKPGWWLLLYFIPFVNIVIAILVALGVSRNFGKGGGFAVGVIFLPFIFYPILGFGDATYGPAAPPAAAAPTAA